MRTYADSAPSRRWQRDGWSVTFKAIPKKPEARESNSRSIGIYGHTGVGWIDDAPAIRKAITSKHHEYGELDAPFIIAVGTYIHDRDRWHTTNAMYGALAVQLSEGPDGEMATREVRQPDGYFGAAPDWQNRNISGVLLVNELMPYYLHRAVVMMWRHPNPLHELPDQLGLPSHAVALDDGRGFSRLNRGGVFWSSRSLAARRPVAERGLATSGHGSLLSSAGARIAA